jgi:outer membrane lipopolysaccharide assembly protein LptE/RlpB
MKKASVLLIVFTVAAVVVFNGCGYRLSGTGKQIPSNIKTIAIPDFDNKTTRVEAEQFVTFAVKEEFIRRSDLKLVSDPSDADSVLEGEIVAFNVTPTSITNEGSANLYQLNIVLSVRFIDLTTNQIIFEGERISFNDTYDIDEDDFFSQETEKLLEISEKFAESVVTTILENF